MTLRISYREIEDAADTAELWEDDYRIREAYSGRGMGSRTCAAMDLPDAGKLTEFLVALAVAMTEDNRADDALRLARLTRTDSMGLGIVAYWPGAEIVD
jgi:hypothetical protein